MAIVNKDVGGKKKKQEQKPQTATVKNTNPNHPANIAKASQSAAQKAAPRATGTQGTQSSDALWSRGSSAPAKEKKSVVGALPGAEPLKNRNTQLQAAYRRELGNAIVQDNPALTQQRASRGTPFASKADEVRHSVTENRKMPEAAKLEVPDAPGKTILTKGGANPYSKGAARKGPTQEPPKRTLTAQEQYEAAEKAYQDYRASDDWKKNRKYIIDEATGTGRWTEDETEQRLKATRDWYKTQVDNEANQKVTAANRAKLDALPQEARDLIDQFAFTPNEGFGLTDGLTNEEQRKAAILDRLTNQYHLDLKTIRELAETREWEQSAADMADMQTRTAERATKNPVGQSIGAIGGSTIGGIGASLGILDDLATRTGQYRTLNPNNPGFTAQTYAGTATGTVAQNIEGDGTSFGRKASAELYQATESAMQNIARMVVGLALGGGSTSLALAGINSFGSTVQEATRNGATPGQAVAMGAVDGATEILTEKLPLDNLLESVKTAKAAGKENLLQFAERTVKEMLKQSAIEVPQEEIGLAAGFLAQQAILGETSDYNRTVNEMVANGYSLEAARSAANKDQLLQVAETALQTFVSSWITAGGGQVAGRMMGMDGQQAQTAAQEQTEGQPQAAPAAPSGENSGNPGMDITDIFGPQKPAAEDTPVNMDAIMEDMFRNRNQETGKVSNKQAEAILNNPEAIASLQEKTGVEISGSKSEQRNAVKQAMELMFGQQTETAETTQQGPETETAGVVDTAAEARQNAENTNASETATVQEIGNTETATDGQVTMSEEAGPEQTEQPKAKESKDKGPYQRTRPDDVRRSRIPVEDANGQRVSETAGNLYGSGYTSDETAAKVKQLAKDGTLGFATKSNDEALDSARTYIAENGVVKTASEIHADVEKGKVSDENIARAFTMYVAAVENGDDDTAAALAVDLTAMGNMSGRNLQMFRLFRIATPEGQLKTAHKGIDAAVEAINRNRNEKNKVSITFDSELDNRYLEAAREVQKAQRNLEKVRGEGGDTEAVKAANNALREAESKRDGIQTAMIEYAGSQIKASGKDVWTAWRNTAMLFNSKTIIRNVGGNVGMVPVWQAKRTIQAGLERLFIKDKSKRATAVVGYSKEDKALRAFARADVQSENVQFALDSGKFSDNTTKSQLQDSRTIFKAKPLEGVRKATGWLLNNDIFGDAAFKNAEYVKSFAGFLKARGITAEQAQAMQEIGNDTVLNEARQYAVNQAMQSTFNDVNQLSEAVCGLHRKGNTALDNTINAVVDSQLPFKKVPANIVARAWEFSPVGLAKGLKNTVTTIQQGGDATKAIDTLSRGLTGSAMMALGYGLAGGIGGLRLRGGMVDDDEKREGAQTYSVEWRGKDGKLHSYKLGWMGAAMIPLFLGVSIHDAATVIGDASMDGFEKFLHVSGTVLGPMLDMTILDGVKSYGESVGRAVRGEEAGFTVVLDAASNYFLQAIPTMAKAVENFLQPNVMMTYTDAEKGYQRSLQRVASKIPVVDTLTGTRMEKRDIWGNTISKGGWAERFFTAFLNPGEMQEHQTTDVEAAITAMNKELPEGEKFAIDKPEQKLTFVGDDGKKESRRLSGNEYDLYSQLLGQNLEDALSDAMELDGWTEMSAEQKKEAFDDAKKEAKEFAKRDLMDYSYLSDSAKGVLNTISLDTHKNAYPAKMSDSVSYTDKNGDNVKRELTAQEYQRVNRTQQNTFNGIMNRAAKSEAFQNLSPNQKLQFAQDAQKYATERAMGDGVDDYFQDPKQWWNKIEGDEVVAIVAKVASGALNSGASSYHTDITNLWDTGESEEAMEESYRTMAAMPKAARKQAAEELEGNAAKYYQGRQAGLAPGDITDIFRRSAEAEDNDVEAIAAVAKDKHWGEAKTEKALRWALPDYDPTAKSPSYEELKLNAAMAHGLTPSQFAATKNAWTQELKGGAGYKQRFISRIQKETGVDYRTAENLYKMYNSFPKSAYGKEELMKAMEEAKAGK